MPEFDDRCFICDRGNSSILETHHIIPQRYGGSDDPENLVTLCPSCHQAIESIYDDEFFRRIGVEDNTVNKQYDSGDLPKCPKHFQKPEPFGSDPHWIRCRYCEKTFYKGQFSQAMRHVRTVHDEDPQEELPSSNLLTADDDGGESDV